MSIFLILLELLFVDNKIINPLIVVLSCQKNKGIWNNILQKNKNIIIFCGDPNLSKDFLLLDNILYLKCEDTYDYLPCKVYKMLNVILKIKKFEKITHIFKIDDHDTQFNNNTISNLKIILNKFSDYCGQKVNFQFTGNNKWHYYKCPVNSKWYNIPYEGKYTPWVDGGCGYILSRKAMEIISSYYEKEDDIYDYHIYEDLMIALILSEYGIYPKKIPKVIEGDKL